MSLHRSLRASETMRRHRSVLTRLERLKLLLAKGAWREEMSPLGLPKVKHLKVMIKKEKAAAPAAATAEGAAPAAGQAPAAKPAAGAKPTSGAKPGAGAKPAAAAGKAEAPKPKSRFQNPA